MRCNKTTWQNAIPFEAVLKKDFKFIKKIHKLFASKMIKII